MTTQAQIINWDWEAIGCPKSREKVNLVLVRDGWGWVFLLILGSNLSGKGPCTKSFRKSNL